MSKCHTVGAKKSPQKCHVLFDPPSLNVIVNNFYVKNYSRVQEVRVILQDDLDIFRQIVDLFSFMLKMC